MSNLPAYLRFRRALCEPETTQRQKLRACLEHNAHTAFGETHGFDAIHNYEEFAHRVPLADYDAFEPWIEKICHGEKNILTRDPVTHLVPTSGSTGARKLIPFTAGLQREFNAAIGPWLVDLARHHPRSLGGPAYWSVTPVSRDVKREESAVPIGFDADTAYLGGAQRRLADAIMAVPPEVQRAKSLETFRYETLLHLLRCRGLRLISVWHPSFLTLLLDSLPEYWDRLLADVVLRRRGKELRAANPLRPETLWPDLKIISCWGDGAAESALSDLRRRFPNVVLQPKGLLSTEAVVTIPFGGLRPLAIASHFFEFIDEQDCVRLAHELRANQTYEVVVTTAGGLWRYRMGDTVQVTGFLCETPSLRFLGRRGNVSDLSGEKLSDAFVAKAVQEITAAGKPPPRFVLLAPEQSAEGWRYTLYWEGETDSRLAQRVDESLHANPHYAVCRDLGQLQPPRVFRINAHGHETFISGESVNGRRLGDVKPCYLSRRTDWAKHFQGEYAPNQICQTSARTLATQS